MQIISYYSDVIRNVMQCEALVRAARNMFCESGSVCSFWGAALSRYLTLRGTNLMSAVMLGTDTASFVSLLVRPLSSLILVPLNGTDRNRQVLLWCLIHY